MNATTAKTLPIVLLAALAPPLGSQDVGAGHGETEPARILITHPLRLLCGRTEHIPPLPLWSFLGGREDCGDVRHLCAVPEGGERLFEPDSLMQVLRECHPDTLDVEDGATLDHGDGDLLFLTGDGKALRDIVGTLAKLEGILARGIEIEAALYEWSDDHAPRAMVDADGLAETVADHALLWRGTARTRSGNTAALGQQQWQRYVRDADVEVAEGSQIGVPTVATSFEGISVVVEPHALAGSSDLLLFCQLAIGRRRGQDAARSTGVAGLPTQDVPRIDVDSGTMSGKIRDGGALLYSVVSPEWAGSSLLLAVSARYLTPRVPVPDGQRILPVSALFTGSLTQRAVQTEAEESGRGDTVLPGELDGETLGFVDDDRLQDLIRNSVTPDEWDEQATLFTAGGFLFLRGDRDTLDLAERLVLELQTRWVKNTEVQLTATMTPADPKGAPFARPDAGAPASTLHRVTFPALAGRTHLCVHGVETTAIRTMWAEIGKSSALLDPYVIDVFSGLYASVEPYLTDSRLGAAAEVRLAHVPPARRRELGNEDGGDVYLTSTAVARFAHDGAVASGEALDLGFGPTVRRDNRAWRTQQAVRITAR